MTTEEQRSKSATDALNELNVTRSSPLLQCSHMKNKRPRGVDDAEADAGSRKSSSKHTEAECPPKKLRTSKMQAEAQQIEESDINTSATQRTKRGPSKMPAGRYVITKFDPTGKHVEPKNVVGPYHTALGVIVRETVPIKYRFWHKKTKPNEKEWCVPPALKEKCWKKLKEKFEFPQAYEELAKKQALQSMGNSFRSFKCKLNSEHVQTRTEPIWDHYPFQRPYWQEFVSWKGSEDALAMREINIVNSHKNDNPHRTGSRGYAGKIPEWEKQLQQLTEKGVTLHTDGWDERSLRYLLARGMTFKPDGSLSFPSDAVRNLAEKIKTIQEEVANGIFKPEREDDVLTRALGTKEHPGRTRGVGLVPWQHAFPDDISTYRSRTRRNAQRDVQIKAMMEAYFDREWEQREKQLRAEIMETCRKEVAVEDDGARGTMGSDKATGSSHVGSESTNDDNAASGHYEENLNGACKAILETLNHYSQNHV